jgi:hypothetical protein
MNSQISDLNVTDMNSDLKGFLISGNMIGLESKYCDQVRTSLMPV